MTQRAGLDKRPREVAEMFDAVSQRYDLTNDVLTFGQDRLWRRAVAAALEPAPGQVILDLAAGTGESSTPLVAAGARVIACDFSLGMLRVGVDRNPQVEFVAGDALALPFADATFDSVTISFGLRNIVDPAAALAEMRRVTRAGGTLVVCEFSRAVFAPFRVVYEAFLRLGLPRIARLVSSAPEAYEYLVESIDSWPPQDDLADVIGASGWREAAWRNLFGGVVAVHRARA